VSFFAVVRFGRGASPRAWLALLLLTSVVILLARTRGASDETLSESCEARGLAGCEPASATVPTTTGVAPLEAAQACLSVGYLCSELERTDRIRIQRWKDFSGTLVVHVPLPDFEERADGVALQRAAAAGIRAWNGQPFPVQIDLRGTLDAHFSVKWARSLGGTQLGVARTQWSAETGRRVLAIELATRNPFDQTHVLDARQIRLTAAHEMGHALGLPHSDAERDVMFPTNTATSLSARDYRTMEALYALEDGAEIVRR
jgi:hypothetical protein